VRVGTSSPSSLDEQNRLTCKMTTGSLARKTSDLILERTGRWLNLEPSHPIEIGEYGDIDLESGKFISHGNIYKSEAVKAFVPDILDHQPRLGKVVDEEKVKTKDAYRWSFDRDPKITVPDIVAAPEKLLLQVQTNHRAAYLITKTSRTESLPRDALFKRLSNVKELADMYLVTDRTVSQGYGFGISTIGNRIMGDWVEPGEGETGFAYNGNTTVEWSIGAKAEDFAYVPAFKLMRMHPHWVYRLLNHFPYRDLIHHVADKDLWVPATPPWAPLNAEGGEVLPDDG